MNITKGIRRNVLVQLTRRETRLWEDGGEKGSCFRRATREAARAYAEKHGISGSIEIYAAQSEGGWTADVERIEAA